MNDPARTALAFLAGCAAGALALLGVLFYAAAYLACDPNVDPDPERVE